jgi:hypothetical protein
MYLHPIYNYAILTYDKALLGETLIKEIELSDKDLVQGDSVNSVGVHNYLPAIKKTTVFSIEDVITSKCSPPRWRAMNVEGIKVADHLESSGIYNNNNIYIFVNLMFLYTV